MSHTQNQDNVRATSGRAPLPEAAVSDAARAWVTRVLGVSFLSHSEPTPAAHEKAFSVVGFTKAQLAWRTARTTALAAIEQAGGKLASIYETYDLGTDFLTEFDDFVAPLRAELNDSLDDLLDAVRVQLDPAERRKSLGAVRKRAHTLKSSFQTSQIIQTLERNPVTPATFRRPLGDSIDELLRVSEG
jgi:hypothetical protein